MTNSLEAVPTEGETPDIPADGPVPTDNQGNEEAMSQDEPTALTVESFERLRVPTTRATRHLLATAIDWQKLECVD